MLNSMQVLTVIKDTLGKMGSKYSSHDAIMLVYRTGLVESRYEYLYAMTILSIAKSF